jgi:outer membrane protein assembly factor BamA
MAAILRASLATLFPLLWLFLCAGPLLSQGRQTLIEDVQVRGNRRIPVETIKYYLQTKPGQALDRATIKRDVRALNSLGYFDDIRVEEDSELNGQSSFFMFTKNHSFAQ